MVLNSALATSKYSYIAVQYRMLTPLQLLVKYVPYCTMVHNPFLLTLLGHTDQQTDWTLLLPSQRWPSIRPSTQQSTTAAAHSSLLAPYRPPSPLLGILDINVSRLNLPLHFTALAQLAPQPLPKKIHCCQTGQSHSHHNPLRKTAALAAAHRPLRLAASPVLLAQSCTADTTAT